MARFLIAHRGDQAHAIENTLAAFEAAAAAGHSVMLVEQQTIASATSSNSTKLIHGGLRYLESLQLGLVYMNHCMNANCCCD